MPRPNYPTASQIDRAMHCPASWTLPRSQLTTEDSARGTALHRYLEAAVRDGPEKALSAVPAEYRSECAALQLERLPRLSDYAAEVALSWDYRTGLGREVGRGLERAYDAGPSEFVGTADLVGVTEHEVVVHDFKSGRLSMPAAESWQLRALALFAARAYGKRAATVALVSLATGESSVAALSERDMEETAEALQRLAQRVDEQRGSELPDTHRGPWCQWCPSFSHCPGQTALIRELAIAPAEQLELTPETAGRAFVRLREIEAVAKRVREAIDAYARQNPIPLPNGKTYGPVAAERECIAGHAAIEVLTEKYGPEIAARATEVKVSKASIREALKDVAPRGSLAEYERQAMAALRDAKATYTQEFVKMEEK